MANQFVVKVVNNWEIVAKGFLDLKDELYKFCDVPKRDIGSTTLIAQIDDRNRVWHE